MLIRYLTVSLIVAMSVGLTFGPLVSTAKALKEQDLLDKKTLPTLYDQLDQAKEFKSLLSAADLAELTETLKGTETFTLLAPNDAAFEKLPPETMKMLMLPANKQKLAGVLSLHLIRGDVPLGQLFASKKVKTLKGLLLPLQIFAGNYLVDLAKVIGPDIECVNGRIHVIDRVLVPLE